VVAIARARGQAVALEFVTLRVPDLQGSGDDAVGTPRTRSQLGIRGSGVNQSIEAVFLVLDAAGAAAVDGTIIDFSLFGPNGGEAVFPTSAPSISGFVSTTISTGTRPGPVEVEARVHGTAIIARAIPLSIGGALNPAASSLSLAAECLNVAGSVTFGLTDTSRASISDQFHNPIPIGSVVSFFTEGGGIASQGVLTDDQLSANATLVTQAPVPFDHRVTVLAVTTGQETFTDLNANGQFDPGEPFEDLPPEPFLDENENGVYDLGEFFIDRNNNGVFDGTPNGVWDDQILISASIPIIFSGHTQVSVDPSSFSVPAGGSVELTLFVRDEVSQPLVGGTKIDITGTNVTVSPKQIVIPDTTVNPEGRPIPDLTQFTIIVSTPKVEPTPVPSGAPTGVPTPESTPAPQAASVTIKVTSEVDGGQQNHCPGGNGDVTVTVPGEIGG